MLVKELISIAEQARAGQVHDVVIHMPSGGPGIPSTTWDVTGITDGLSWPAVSLVADAETDGMTVADLIVYLSNYHDAAEVLVFTADGDGTTYENTYGITDAYVDSDGPSEYGADDAYSALTIVLEF